MTRTADLVTAVLIMLLGAVVIADSVRLGAGWGTDGPKSGFFPFWLGTLLVLTSAALIAQAWRRSDSKPFVSRDRLKPVLIVLSPAVGLVVLTQFVGLYVASALYIGGYMRWVGAHRWMTVAALAIGIPLVTFIIFERWFLVPMPKGPLETWLGY
jgi:putative tricarboxylic transport membrane protein